MSPNTTYSLVDVFHDPNRIEDDVSSRRGKVQKKPMNEGQRRGNVVHAPDVVDIDTLAYMQDVDLAQRIKSLEESKDHAIECGFMPVLWEVELAYVMRERLIRRERREAHMEFTRREQADFYASEVGLPTGDLDNLAYVFAAQGGHPRWS